MPKIKNYQSYLIQTNNYNFQFTNIDVEIISSTIDKLAPKPSYGFTHHTLNNNVPVNKFLCCLDGGGHKILQSQWGDHKMCTLRQSHFYDPCQ